MRNLASMPMEAHSSGKVWLSRMLDDAIFVLCALIVVAAACAKLSSRSIVYDTDDLCFCNGCFLFFAFLGDAEDLRSQTCHVTSVVMANP